MRFVGIDLAWSPKNRSGGAVVSEAGELLASSATLGNDLAVLDFITDALPAGRPGVVAIDAPLVVPNENGGRPCDKQVAAVFRRFEAAPYLANRQNLGRYGGLRAEAIRQELESLGFRHDPHLERRSLARRVVEVFPHPATISLFHLERTLKYKSRQKRDYDLRWRELGRLRDHLASLAGSDPPLLLPAEISGMAIEGRRGRRLKEAEDLLDAIVCAYAALYAWHHGPQGYAVYGDAEQGHILVPMTPGMWERIKVNKLRNNCKMDE